MFKKCVVFSKLVFWVGLLTVGFPSYAQDACVTEYMANLALPSTVVELRQYINDLRDVLRDCDPMSDDVIEFEPKAKLKFEDYVQDDNDCYYGVMITSRTSSPFISGLATSGSALLEMKKPGESRFNEATFDESLSDRDDDTDAHVWDGPFPKGRYEVRYEAFIGADPVTLAFDVEHNAMYIAGVICD